MDFSPSKPFLSQDARSAGLTARQLQNRRFQSVARGVKVPTDTPLDLRTRCAAMGLVLADGVVFSHHTAAKLYGAPIAADSQLHVSLVSPIEPRIEGVSPHRVLELGPVWQVAGLPVTSPGRTFVDLAARLDLPGLVEVGDGLLRLPSARETFDLALERGTKRRGIRLARLAYPLLNPRSDSAPESRLRLLLTQAGFPPDYVNEPMCEDDGYQWAKPDLGYLVRLALEYEGAHHRDDPRQWQSDIGRDNRYADHDWHLIKVTAAMLYQRPEQLVAEVARVLRRRGWRRAA